MLSDDDEFIEFDILPFLLVSDRIVNRIERLSTSGEENLKTYSPQWTIICRTIAAICAGEMISRSEAGALTIAGTPYLTTTAVHQSFVGLLTEETEVPNVRTVYVRPDTGDHRRA